MVVVDPTSTDASPALMAANASVQVNKNAVNNKSEVLMMCFILLIVLFSFSDAKLHNFSFRAILLLYLFSQCTQNDALGYLLAGLSERL